MMDGPEYVGGVKIGTKEQLKEARSVQDDWTGKTSAAERRKAQNRLHQRAWRRRKAQQNRNLATETETTSAIQTGDIHGELEQAWAAATKALLLPTLIPQGYPIRQGRPPHSSTCSTSPTANSIHPAPAPAPDASLPQQSQDDLTTSLNPFPLVPHTTNGPLIPPLLPYDRPALAIPLLFPLSPDHYLITLIQYNVLRAVTINLTLTKLIDVIPLTCQSAMALPLLHEPPAIPPPTFTPTSLQRKIKHHFWIDSVPCPQLRDNLITASAVGLDEDELCVDVCGGLYEGFDDCAQRGLLVWGDPWVVANWEISPGFVRKWGFLLRGCVEMMRATNRWREARSEDPIVVEVDRQIQYPIGQTTGHKKRYSKPKHTIMS